MKVYILTRNTEGNKEILEVFTNKVVAFRTRSDLASLYPNNSSGSAVEYKVEERKVNTDAVYSFARAFGCVV